MRVAVEYDNSSGDKDPFDDRSERFDTLYGARSFELGPSGIYGPFVRSNLKALGLRLSVQPHARLSAMVAYRGNRLASATDAWPPANLRDEAGLSGDAIGRRLQTAVNWVAIPDRKIIDFGLTLLHFGRFARTVPNAIGRSSSTYIYGAITVRFGSY